MTTIKYIDHSQPIANVSMSADLGPLLDRLDNIADMISKVQLRVNIPEIQPKVEIKNQPNVMLPAMQPEIIIQAPACNRDKIAEPKQFKIWPFVVLTCSANLLMLVDIILRNIK